MRILQVARYGSVKGGAETYVRALCAGLRDAGHEVALAYGAEPDMDRPEVAAGFHVPSLVEQNDGGLVKVIDRFNADVVHVHLPDVPWVARAAAQRTATGLAVPDHRLNCPVGTKYWAGWKRACTVHPGLKCLAYNVVAHCGSLRANVTLQPYRNWRAAKDASADIPLQVFSEHMRSQLAATGMENAIVTPYPVPPRARPRPPTIDPDPRPVVFASGRLNKEKGFHELIDAMGRCRTRAHLVIAGDGHERAALERRARGTTGGHAITFTGWLNAESIAGWYERAAVVAIPSMWPEPFGIAGLEAMAAERAVVAFDSGGISEWLAEGETGRLVAPGDVRALGETIDALLRDPDERQRMGQAGAARATNEFSLVSHVERVVAWYGDIMRDRERAA